MAVALYKIPDSSACLTTSLRMAENTFRLNSSNTFMSRAGLSDKLTGGSCAVSPTSISLQFLPLYTYSIRSSSKRPDPKIEESGVEFEIIEASSTIKSVFDCLL